MGNNPLNKDELLQDQRVVDEINRHLWIESEKAGYDIGFDKAKEEWLEKFSKAWMTYHMPERSKSKAKLQSVFISKQADAAQPIEDAASRKRRAKSYL